jgi:acetyl-CoA synthetase (ADP-forming)
MHKLIDKALVDGYHLNEAEAWELFSDYDIPTPQHQLVRSAEEALDVAKRIGYPVVMKVVSRDILHKSDAGGVKLNITKDEELSKAYHAIINDVHTYKPEAVIEGILVCEMFKGGLECIIGMTQDVSFGPTLMFGLGGIFVEVLEDVSFRVLPLSREDASSMIHEIKAYSLLQGIRGQSPRDVDTMIDLMLKVAKMIEENPAIKELDINPCFIFEEGKGIMPADARVML